MSETFHACMIAGTHSGAGKTTVMAALAALARQKNLTVQPFKGGPDYIDPGFHEKASGRKCRNLDLVLLSPEYVQQSFARNSHEAHLSLVEGMMGLYDGKGAEGEGSSAQIAKRLNLPVILVLDGAGLANSAAAIVLGFQKFDPSVRLAGVIFNRVKHDGHFQYLKNAVESKTGVACLGFLPPDESMVIPERHLGLKTSIEDKDCGQKIARAADLLTKHLDWNEFLKITQMARPAFIPKERAQKFSRPFRIAVARDEAFSFYYEDNFDLLQDAGAQLNFFSPLRDTEMPEADLLYMGGGFPELYAAGLSSNKDMLFSIKNFYHNGGWIYAECGGLMYLSEGFCDAEGREVALAGLVPGKTRMTNRLQNFGYHKITAAAHHFLFAPGTQMRSHEFHHSVWDEEGKQAPAYTLGERREGFTAPRLVATYQHLHFGSLPGIAASLIHTIEKERNFVC
jgi:cobyrinic acid a,c-diamide synthase